MVSVAKSNDEIWAKQIEVKATGASDVKIYANGANQKAGGAEVADNSVGKTSYANTGNYKCPKTPKGKNDLFGINKPQKENPFGKFDIDDNKKLDKAELLSMIVYAKEQLAQLASKPKKTYKPDETNNFQKPNNDFLLILIGILIAQIMQQNKIDLIGKNEKEGKKPLLEMA